MTRNDALFSIRYAVRVLERSARYWAKIDGAIRIAALLAGSGAIYAISIESRPIAIGFGIFFAITQAIEFALRPADKSALAMGARLGYARLMADQSSHEDAALERAYQQLVAVDEVIVMECLRRIAYNDVLYERGHDPAHAYSLSAFDRFMSVMA